MTRTEGHGLWCGSRCPPWRAAAPILTLAMLWGCATYRPETLSASRWSSPLHEAAERHDLDAAIVLLQAGADVDSLLWGYGVPPLAIATWLGDEEMMNLLLAHGANVNAQDTVGNTPLHAAAGSFASPASTTALLLSAGADPNIRGRHGATPLLYAARAGKAEVVTLLIESGADIDVQEQFMYASPLDSAATLGHFAVVEALLAAGAEVDIHSPYGTPLHSAALSEHDDIAALLLQNGADVNAMGYGDSTALHLAAGACGEEDIGRTEPADLLISHGAQINAIACDGTTPLDAAAQVGDEAMVALLLLHDARSGYELLASERSAEPAIGAAACQ